MLNDGIKIQLLARDGDLHCKEQEAVAGTVHAGKDWMGCAFEIHVALTLHRIALCVVQWLQHPCRHVDPA